MNLFSFESSFKWFPWDQINYCRPEGICEDLEDSGGLFVSQDVPSSIAIYANIKIQWVVSSSGQNLSYHLIMLDVWADSSLPTSNCLLTLILFFSICYTHPECIMHKSTINSILSLFILLWSWLGKMLELKITKFQIRSKGCYTHPVFIPPQTVICRQGSELILARLLTSSPIVSLSPPSPAIPAWLFLIMYLFV